MGGYVKPERTLNTSLICICLFIHKQSQAQAHLSIIPGLSYIAGVS